MDANERGSNGPGGRYGPGRADEFGRAPGAAETDDAAGRPGAPGAPAEPGGSRDRRDPRDSRDHRDSRGSGDSGPAEDTADPADPTGADAAPGPPPGSGSAAGSAPGPGSGSAAVSLPNPRPEVIPAPGPGPASGPGLAPGPRTDSADEGHASARGGVAALSLPYRIVAALVLGAVAAVACVHLGTVFLYVAPSNTVTKAHGKAVDDWIYPEFEQNWKLFAPNPLQQNVGVQVRAETRAADGAGHTTNWYDLSAEDGRAIEGNPVPSHTEQNELRRAFDFYSSSHDGENRSTGLRGALSEQYLRRIVVLRLHRDRAAGSGGVLERVQIRVRTTSVAAPPWSGENVSTAPVYRLLPWWTVPADEARGGVR
ncbi:DUF5819 family protein [Streptomyces sp. NPDC018610]|uniref:DUF5819 family protein n=1 Tax=Streptomyces sp. NPDC018610 TaxID=3365049 RepID=UPI00379D73C6